MRADIINAFEWDPKKVSYEGLIELVLGGEVKQVAENVCSAYGMKGRENICLGTADFRDFMQLGMTKARAIRLAAAVELGRRVENSGKRILEKFDNAKAISAYFMERCRYEEQEHFYALYLNNKLRFLGLREICTGDGHSATVDIQHIFRWGVRYGASFIVVLHNHPSGFPEPSQQDDEITECLSKAGAIMGIPVVDHIVIGDDSYYSYQESGRI